MRSLVFLVPIRGPDADRRLARFADSFRTERFHGPTRGDRKLAVSNDAGTGRLHAPKQLRRPSG